VRSALNLGRLHALLSIAGELAQGMACTLLLRHLPK
jgi:hypothetical protein